MHTCGLSSLLAVSVSLPHFLQSASRSPTRGLAGSSRHFPGHWRDSPMPLPLFGYIPSPFFSATSSVGGPKARQSCCLSLWPALGPLDKPALSLPAPHQAALYTKQRLMAVSTLDFSWPRRVIWPFCLLIGRTGWDTHSPRLYLLISEQGQIPPARHAHSAQCKRPCGHSRQWVSPPSPDQLQGSLILNF